MRSAIITSPVNLVTAEAASNRIIFLPASKSNVTCMQRKKKKKFITTVDVLTFPVKLTLKREYSSVVLSFHSTWPQDIHWKAKFFLPFKRLYRLDRYSKRVVLFCWNGIQNWILRASQKIWNSWFSFFSRNKNVFSNGLVSSRFSSRRGKERKKKE